MKIPMLSIAALMFSFAANATEPELIMIKHFVNEKGQEVGCKLAITDNGEGITIQTKRRGDKVTLEIEEMSGGGEWIFALMEEDYKYYMWMMNKSEKRGDVDINSKVVLKDIHEYETMAEGMAAFDTCIMGDVHH